MAARSAGKMQKNSLVENEVEKELLIHLLDVIESLKGRLKPGEPIHVTPEEMIRGGIVLMACLAKKNPQIEYTIRWDHAVDKYQITQNSKFNQEVGL